ncbi:MAG: phosphatidylglycerophosphatase A [Bdellovibrionales bacterium]|nr:phosphatidylglycerophosphatase A [Bdellovibrionales bacterium]
MLNHVRLKNQMIQLLATAGGLGKAPRAPGTFGTLAGIPFIFFFAKLNPLIAFLGTFSIVVGAVFVADAYQTEKGGDHDRQEIVIDEVAGFLIAMAMIPLTWQTWVAGFLLFRFFDALKPWPISVLDRRVKGGLGVVVDDVAAGLVANLILQILITKTDWLGVQILSL